MDSPNSFLEARIALSQSFENQISKESFENFNKNKNLKPEVGIFSVSSGVFKNFSTKPELTLRTGGYDCRGSEMTKWKNSNIIHQTDNKSYFFKFVESSCSFFRKLG